MPLYEYRCEGCEHEFGEIQKFSDDPLVKCPSCKKNKLHKKFSLSAIAMRGPGFSETKIGRKRKADMIRRSEKLAKSQWDNVEPVKVPEGRVVKNPTPGGPYDKKKKEKPIISYKK